MSKIVHEIVQHDGRWAYRVNGTCPERFATHDEARTAAARAAQEQREPGISTFISWEDSSGHWHKVLPARGSDRPETTVKG